jgi:hypothetical protein
MKKSKSELDRADSDVQCGSRTHTAYDVKMMSRYFRFLLFFLCDIEEIIIIYFWPCLCSISYSKQNVVMFCYDYEFCEF